MSKGEWKVKLWSNFTREYYIAMKTNESGLSVTAVDKAQNLMVSKNGKEQKIMWFHFYEVLISKKPIIYCLWLQICVLRVQRHEWEPWTLETGQRWGRDGGRSSRVLGTLMWIILLPILLDMLKYLIKTKKKWCEHCHCNRGQHSACLRTKMGRKCVKNSGAGEAGTWMS